MPADGDASGGRSTSSSRFSITRSMPYPGTRGRVAKVRQPIRVVDFGSRQGLSDVRRPRAPAPALRRTRPESDRRRAACRPGHLLQWRRRALWLPRGSASSKGDLRTFAPEAVDVMIALHACDTATDHAIGPRPARRRRHPRLLAVLPQGARPPATRRPRLLSGDCFRHGIHLGQEAEMVTDSMRALLLETPRLRGAGVRVRLARAHEQEQDDPRPAAAQRGPSDIGQSRSAPRAELAEPQVSSTAFASSASRPGCSRAEGPLRVAQELERPREGQRTQ